MSLKTVSLLSLTGVLMSAGANAAYSDSAFKKEIKTGVDILSTRANIDVVIEDAPGEMGAEVYQTLNSVGNGDMDLFVPTSNYLRMGGGISLGFASNKADFDGQEYEANQGYTVQLGLGWNLSSYVRAELGVQNETLKFSSLKDYSATYYTGNAMLYFDFARRYVQTGDVTHRRHFVPFMGIGAGTGYYDFQGPNGADGFVIAAPRAELGFNIMLNEVIGIDIAYQYQMMIGNGFGWDTRAGGVDGISNVVASIRANF